MNPLFRKEIFQLLKIAWPVVLGQLGHVTVGVADSAMIGQTGTIPLAAASLANSIFILPLVFGIGIAYGVTPLVANAHGQSDLMRLGRLLSQGILINGLMGVILMALLFLLRPLIAYSGQQEEVLELALPYLGILIASILPFMLFLSLKQFAEGLSDTRPAMYISLGANLLNVLLNYLLIFGKWGLPELGIMGAGYATWISRSIMLFGLFLYFLLHPNYVQYRVDLLPRRIEWERIRRILSIGIPTGLQYLFEVGAFAAAAILIGTIGAMPLAAHQVAISLASISYMAASGIGAAASVRVGNAAGRKDPIGIRRTGSAAVVLVLILMGTAGFIFAVFRQQLPAFYSGDAAVIRLSAQLLLVAVFFQFSDGLQALALGLLRGMEDVLIPTWIAFAVYWGFSLPASWLIGLHLGIGLFGIWIVLALALSLSAPFLGWRFHSLSRKALRAPLV